MSKDSVLPGIKKKTKNKKGTYRKSTDHKELCHACRTDDKGGKRSQSLSADKHGAWKEK